MAINSNDRLEMLREKMAANEVALHAPRYGMDVVAWNES